MPELPEVETTRRGIAPLVEGRRVEAVTVREPRLRWPVPTALARDLPGQRLGRVSRRAKFLLVESPIGHLILHLGMSGSLRIVSRDVPADKHDHLDIVLDETTTAACGCATRAASAPRCGPGTIRCNTPC